MNINKNILRYIEKKLRIKFLVWHTASGGSINQSWYLQTAAQKYFIKTNNGTLYPGMFEAEAAGLNLIAGTKATAVPEVILTGKIDNESFLLLEWIDIRRPTSKASITLGRQLAKMHQSTAEYFGLDSDNYMGSLPQSNKKHKTWAAFFVEDRLQPMVKLATDNHSLNSHDIKNFETLYKKLPDLFEEEAPSLLHGDLWCGNYLTGMDETPYLIDPAVSFGHREFDIAMTTLFGGFSHDFYVAYHESMPLTKGWEQRVDLWNLYPLLLHLNLFGVGYLGRLRNCLKGYL